MAGKYLDLTGLAYFWGKIKQLIPRLSKKTQSIPFGQVDSTSTATVFTATIDGIDELRDGVCCYLRNGVITSASGWTLNINGLGAKPVYQTMADASRTTTIFNINYTFLFVYNSTRVENGCWDVYYGYNTNEDYRAYQVRTNSSTLPAKFKTYRYRLLFTSADGNYYVGANASTSTNATGARTPTTEKIDPFGRIVYYATSTAVNADADFSTSYLYQQSTFTLGYSFNSTGGALVLEYPKPVYIKCAPQTDGSAIIDADNPYVQALPEEEDGKIYIFLGFAYSETSVELTLEHPIYYYQGGAIRLWTNQAVQDMSNKADKVVGATSGNFAGLDANGNLTDSGYKHEDFVTSLGTSGNNVTWTKNGVTNNITVPYATNAGTATKLGSSTVGASNRPIYLNAGVPTVTNPGESFLSWGGKNLSDAYGPIDAAMVSELGACRTMFAKANGINIEYSTDGGTTWLDYGATNGEKVCLFSSGTSFIIGKATKETASAQNMLRVTLYTGAAGIYTALNKFVIYVSTNGSTGTYCTIRCRTQQNYEDNIDTWKILANQVLVSGWPGYNVINFPSTSTYGIVKSSQYGEWQFIFGCTGHGDNYANYAGMIVSKIFGFGGVGWTTPSTMAKTGHLYSYDWEKNATFPANVTATSFIKSGGTSSQFLKADGSVDSNTYITSAALPSLPLSIANGGTGATTAKAAEYAINGSMTEDVGLPEDTYRFVFSYINPSSTNGVFVYRTAATIWSWVENKITSVLGIEGSDGVPTAPTATAGTNTTQLATTAFVQSAVNSNSYCANLQTTSTATYNTVPEVQKIKINGDNTLTTASTENCEMVYDKTDKCLKFVFN